MSTFVSVGNAKQPFTRLLDRVAECSPDFPQPILVQRGHTPFSSRAFECVEFVGMTEYQFLMENAELVIIQAGAGGIFTAVQAGKVPVIVPRLASSGEIIDDHQLEFGREIARSGRVIMIENITDLSDAANRALAKQREGLEDCPKPELLRLVASTINQLATKKA